MKPIPACPLWTSYVECASQYLFMRSWVSLMPTVVTHKTSKCYPLPHELKTGVFTGLTSSLCSLTSSIYSATFWTYRLAAPQTLNTLPCSVLCRVSSWLPCTLLLLICLYRFIRSCSTFLCRKIKLLFCGKAFPGSTTVDDTAWVLQREGIQPLSETQDETYHYPRNTCS